MRGKPVHEMPKENKKSFPKIITYIAAILVIVLVFYLLTLIPKAEGHEPPVGYQKVWIQEKGDSLFPSTLNGFISDDEIDNLLNKSSGVKVYQDTSLTSYTYFTVDDLDDMLVTVGKHSSLCDDCK